LGFHSGIHSFNPPLSIGIHWQIVVYDVFSNGQIGPKVGQKKRIEALIPNAATKRRQTALIKTIKCQMPPCQMGETSNVELQWEQHTCKRDD
jgi:hypothetical protein